ncbi:MAG: hypothetical protein CMG49_00840 [Candidatus Marinimicrobia bacterium]|nr:hypothetical protein [Candidatus Neomarinimicrobiota bacterium]|tara:strand:- start:773 stop:1402 length:630 start_codon:yes stop_codon:yes gene_type:complete
MSNQIKNILKKTNLENFDFQFLLNRNIILLIVTLLFISLNYILVSFFFISKIDLIEELEEEQKIVNEKFITAQILSEELDNVYSVFEQNLAANKNDPKNKESNMLFLKDLTDILEKLEIKLIQIEPGGKKRKGLLTLIPYTMELKCNYEEIGKLVTELEASNRLITVDEIIIKNGIEKIKKNSNNQDAINDVKTILSINTVTLNKPKQK